MNICELERFRCNDSALPLQCRSSHRQHVSLPVSINLCLWTLNGEIYTVFKGRKILPLTLSQLLKNVKPFIGHGLNKHRRQAGFNPLAGCGLLTLALDQCFLFFFLLVVLHAACGNFVARPGMEPVPPAVEAWGLNCRKDHQHSPSNGFSIVVPRWTWGLVRWADGSLSKLEKV